MAGSVLRKRSLYLTMVTSSLFRRRSRMAVAVLAISVGATVLSGLVAIHYDVPRQMGMEFRSYGANLILLPADGVADLGAAAIGRAVGLLPASSVVGVAPYRYERVAIGRRPFMAAGTDLVQARKTAPFWYVDGAWPTVRGNVLVGRETADLLRLAPGKSVTISFGDSAGEGGLRTFRIAGILETGGAEEAFVFMALPDLEDAMGDAGTVDFVECSVAAGESELAATAALIRASVGEVAPRLVKRVTQSQESVLGKLRALVYLVTAVVLSLILICVATTMSAAVLERRREIGLKKALGATNLDLALEFMGEGAFLGGLGGLLGSALGALFSRAVGRSVFGRPTDFPLWLVGATLAVSVLMTALACLLPVRGATEIEPAAVLRGE